MNNIDITAVPERYKLGVKKELRGTLHEVSYPAANYIDSSRRLVTNQHIASSEAGRETIGGEAITKKCNIYLPAGYQEQDKDTKYNVLYMLHGVGGDQDEWLSGNGKTDGHFIICHLFDNLIANGDAEPFIVVFPNGRSAHDWTDITFNFAGTNLLGFYYFDYELRYDLIPFIESSYNTYANIEDTSQEGIQFNRRHRAIAGLSMGGMQCLNLVLGGYRYDSIAYLQSNRQLKNLNHNGLEMTVPAPGMKELFAYVGTFSNAPTSSEGQVLGTSIHASEHRMHLLYMNCGDADQIAMDSYAKSIDGLIETAGNQLDFFYQILIHGGVHDFNVWNSGAYHFIRLSFRHVDEQKQPNVFRITL